MIVYLLSALFHLIHTLTLCREWPVIDEWLWFGKVKWVARGLAMCNWTNEPKIQAIKHRLETLWTHLIQHFHFTDEKICAQRGVMIKSSTGRETIAPSWSLTWNSHALYTKPCFPCRWSNQMVQANQKPHRQIKASCSHGGSKQIQSSFSQNTYELVWFQKC